MNSNIVGGLIKCAYPSFDVTTFENRLKLQKFFFLMKAWKLDLGYPFNLYLRGPYSPELTRDAFQISDWNSIPQAKFESAELGEKFQKFLVFFKKHEDDVDFLEAASTLLWFREIYPRADHTTLTKEVIKVKNKFKESYVNSVIDSLHKEAAI